MALMKTSIASITSFTHMLPPIRGIFTTSCLFGAPIRKKKRIDPLLLKKRTERKLRKLEREIDRLENAVKQFKPIIELHLTPQVLKEMPIRRRTDADLSAERDFVKISKLWSIYKCEQSMAEMRSIAAVVESQRRALHHLKHVSPQLYEAAISVDPHLIPHRVDDVMKVTPPEQQYESPDGKLTDVTKQWTM